MVEFALVMPLLFVLLLGVLEAGRYILYYGMLNHATREGTRYAIVHGANASCPSGPPPPGENNLCDPAGDNVKAAVQGAVLDLAATGELFVFDPVWTSRGSISPPAPGATSTGHNGRGEYATVFVDFTYEPVLGQVLDIRILPTIAISAESTLVVNY